MGGGRGLTVRAPEMGMTLSSSSTTRQAAHVPRDKRNLSLKRGTTSSCASVRYREWTSCD